MNHLRERKTVWNAKTFFQCETQKLKNRAATCGMHCSLIIMFVQITLTGFIQSPRECRELEWHCSWA